MVLGGAVLQSKNCVMPFSSVFDVMLMTAFVSTAAYDLGASVLCDGEVHLASPRLIMPDGIAEFVLQTHAIDLPSSTMTKCTSWRFMHKSGPIINGSGICRVEPA